jgi:glutathione S-transferase
MAAKAPVTLYWIRISHPAQAARLMLERKGIPYETVELQPGTHPLLLRLHGFGDTTVPALKLDGRRVQGSREIARALEERQPEPHLYPTDPERRRAVEEAERWGEFVLQPLPRRYFRWALRRHRAIRRRAIEMAGMPAPALVAVLYRPVIGALARKVGSTDESARADLAQLPGLLDHVDALLADGVIGGEEPNAADYQIGTSVRILETFEDFAPLLAGRPAAEHAARILPRLPVRGRLASAALPEWR